VVRAGRGSVLGRFLHLDVGRGALLSGLAADRPVTVCWGGVAEVTPLEQGRELASDADVKLVVLEDADLLPHGEFPTEFLEVLRGELADRTTARPDATA